MKYALIGCGRVSHNHIIAAIRNGLEIAALCDLDAEKIDAECAKYREQLGEVAKYTDYKEMIIREKPELVGIATDSGSHADIAVFCIEHGCHVIIEKPIALSLEDADRVIRAAEENNVKVCNNLQNRFNDAVQILRKAIDDGRFGNVYYGAAQLRWYRGDEYYRQASWRGTWAKDGGALMNQSIHIIDLLCWMMGDHVAEVAGMTDRLAHDCIEAEDLGLAVVRFKNGGYGVIEGTTDINRNSEEETLTIFGEHGTVKLGGISAQVIEQWRFDDGLDDEDEIKKKYGTNPEHIYGLGHISVYEDVIDAIKNDRQPYIDAYAGRRALELVLSVYKAAAEGRTVKFPIEKCATTDFCGRF